MKTLYHYDETTGRFVATSQAEESPLEPGVYHCPRCATFDPVPAFEPVTEYAAYQPAYWPTGIAKEEGGQWRVEAMPQENTTNEGAL